MGTAQAGDHLLVEARVRPCPLLYPELFHTTVHTSRPRYCPDYHLIVTTDVLLRISKVYRLEDCVLKLSGEFPADWWDRR